MIVRRPNDKTVIVHVDRDSSLGMTPGEAITLRDLLLREFPVEQPPLVNGYGCFKCNTRTDRVVALCDGCASNTPKPADPARRERIATACFASLHANRMMSGGQWKDFRDAWAEMTVRNADALIAALDEDKP